MKLDDFIKERQFGEETEYSFYSKTYFFQPSYSRYQDNTCNDTYVTVYEVIGDNSIKIFEGTINELINFKFQGCYTLKDNISKLIFTGCIVERIEPNKTD